jgi:large subunit ribosomal protein L13
LSIEKESNVRTYSATADDVEASREWYVVDAAGQNLGRLATQIATVLRGKHKPLYSPGLDCGDFVIVVNADKVMVTGRKLDQKFYYRYSGYPGGLRQVSLRDQLARHPERVIEAAVKGMLARNRLRDQLIRKLKVYAGPEHPHQAQQPKPFPLAQAERPS